MSTQKVCQPCLWYEFVTQQTCFYFSQCSCLHSLCLSVYSKVYFQTWSLFSYVYMRDRHDSLLDLENLWSTSKLYFVLWINCRNTHNESSCSCSSKVMLMLHLLCRHSFTVHQRLTPTKGFHPSGAPHRLRCSTVVLPYVYSLLLPCFHLYILLVNVFICLNVSNALRSD